jgi:hypothetical protein
LAIHGLLASMGRIRRIAVQSQARMVAEGNFRGAGAKGAEERETGSARIRTRERTGDALRMPTSLRWSAKRIAGRKRRARSPDYGTNGGGWKGR